MINQQTLLTGVMESDHKILIIVDLGVAIPILIRNVSTGFVPMYVIVRSVSCSHGGLPEG